MLATGVCVVFALSSCKSSESAYKKAYEKAKQQELAEPQVNAPVDVTPVTTTSTVVKSNSTAPVRQEKVTVVSGVDGLKEYSVVCGSFGLKANAEAAMYRVIVSTFSDRGAAADARDAFKAKYPNRKDFQGAWLLYRVF